MLRVPQDQPSARTACIVSPSSTTGALCYECCEVSVKLPGFVCSGCKSEYNRQLYEDRMAMNICIGCGWRPRFEGRSHCKECDEKQKARYIYCISEFSCFPCQLGLRYRNSPYCKTCDEAEIQDRKVQRQARIELGLCLVCSATNSEPSYK